MPNDKSNAEGAFGAIPVGGPDELYDAMLRINGNASMRRDRQYDGQPHTDEGERGRSEIRGITFRDLRDCFIRAVLLSAWGVAPDHLTEQAKEGERAILSANDLYGFNLNKLDPMAICQNLSCEVERIMGIFPNLPSAGSPRIRGPFNPEIDRLARLAVQQKEEEDRKLAAMTPEQRDRYIEEWAARVAPGVVADGCAIDRALSGEPAAGPSEAPPEESK